MYVKEMHIEVNQSTQKIAANKTRKIYPEEIDWLLNKNMDRFIKSKVTPRKDGSGGFEIDQTDLDAIRPLVRTRVSLTAFKDDTKRACSILPGDYDSLISDSSVLKRVCDSTVSSSIITENLLVIPVKKSTAASGPYYTTVRLTINSNVEFDISDYTQRRDANYTGLSGVEQIYELPIHILSELKDKGYNAYWERYGDRYFPRSIIIVSITSISGSILLDAATANGTVYTNSYQVLDVTGQDTEEQNNGLTPSSEISNMAGVAFYGTSPEIPLSELAGNKLYVYTDKTFIVTKTMISYVRKPRRISLSLGSDCELAPGYHQAICDLTVEYIKGMIADPNWEVKLKDNMVRNPIL